MWWLHILLSSSMEIAGHDLTYINACFPCLRLQYQFYLYSWARTLSLTLEKRRPTSLLSDYFETYNKILWRGCIKKAFCKRSIRHVFYLDLTNLVENKSKLEKNKNNHAYKSRCGWKGGQQRKEGRRRRKKVEEAGGMG